MNQIPSAQDQAFALLRCPLTHSVLHRVGEHLVASVGGLRYPIENGIAILILDRAALPNGVDSIQTLRESLILSGELTPRRNA